MEALTGQITNQFRNSMKNWLYIQLSLAIVSSFFGKELFNQVGVIQMRIIRICVDIVLEMLFIRFRINISFIMGYNG